MNLPVIEDLEQLFLREMPLLDVRAPVEFSAGTMPGALNLPLLDDAQRHVIGLEYKVTGQDAAIALGEQLATPAIRAHRVAAWRAFVERHPQGALYCFRGGLRSRIAQEWLYQDTGIAYPRIQGGYKALRQFLLQTLETLSEQGSFLVIGGRTGAGKTLLLRRLAPVLDLEALALHRGSAFGRHASPQPCQIDFENALAVALLRHFRSVSLPLVVEDEGKAIGSLHLPPKFHAALKRAPLVVLEADTATRVRHSVQEYVIETLAGYYARFGEQEGFGLWSDYVLSGLERIQRRLGAAAYRRLSAAAGAALAAHRTTADPWVHGDWIADLLSSYYDPMYDYQISTNASRICFSGDAEAVRNYIIRRK